MKQRRVFAFALLTLGIAAVPVALSAAVPIDGRWKTQAGDAVVEFAPCGGFLCGRISKFLVAPPNGNDQRDSNNPDPKLRNRKLIGTAIVYGLKSDGKVWRGTIYDPRNGKSYRSVVKLLKNGKLSVEGCVGPICQAQMWSKSS